MEERETHESDGSKLETWKFWFKPLKTEKSFIKHIGNQLVRSVRLACSTRKNRGCFNPDLEGPLGTFLNIFDGPAFSWGCGGVK